MRKAPGPDDQVVVLGLSESVAAADYRDAPLTERWDQFKSENPAIAHLEKANGVDLRSKLLGNPALKATARRRTRVELNLRGYASVSDMLLDLSDPDPLILSIIDRLDANNVTLLDTEAERRAVDAVNHRRRPKPFRLFQGKMDGIGHVLVHSPKASTLLDGFLADPGPLGFAGRNATVLRQVGVKTGMVHHLFLPGASALGTTTRARLRAFGVLIGVRIEIGRVAGVVAPQAFDLETEMLQFLRRYMTNTEMIQGRLMFRRWGSPHAPADEIAAKYVTARRNRGLNGRWGEDHQETARARLIAATDADDKAARLIDVALRAFTDPAIKMTAADAMYP